MPIPLTAREPVEFTPPATAAATLVENTRLLKEGQPQVAPVKVLVRVPTMYERDSFSAALVRGGVVHYSRPQIRDLMLAGVAYLYPEDQFDRIRADLENLWDAGDAQRDANLKKSQLLVELLEKNEEQPADRQMSQEAIQEQIDAIKPDIILPEAMRVRITAIQQDITARYEPLQKAFADLAEQETRRAWLCVEIYVVNWTGLPYQPEGNGRGGITRLEAEWLRGQIGAEGFEQLAEFIFAMHSLDGDEEKNLASLIENTSAPTGSTVAESKGGSELGSSTDGSSTETPDDASPKTIESSSSSTGRSRKRTARSAPIPTDEASSINP